MLSYFVQYTLLDILISAIIIITIFIVINKYYPIYLIKHITFDDIHREDIPINEDVLNFIYDYFNHPYNYIVSEYVILNIHTNIGIWAANDIINRDFYISYDVDNYNKNKYETINKKLTYIDKLLLDEFIHFVTDNHDVYLDKAKRKFNNTFNNITSK